MFISHWAELRVTNYLCEWTLPSVVLGELPVLLFISTILVDEMVFSHNYLPFATIAEILIILLKCSQISKNIAPVIWGLCIEVLVSSNSNNDNDNEMPPTPLRTRLINKFGGIKISYVVVGESSQNQTRSCLFLPYHWVFKNIRSYTM